MGKIEIRLAVKVLSTISVSIPYMGKIGKSIRKSESLHVSIPYIGKIKEMT